MLATSYDEINTSCFGTINSSENRVSLVIIKLAGLSVSVFLTLIPVFLALKMHSFFLGGGGGGWGSVTDVKLFCCLVH